MRDRRERGIEREREIEREGERGGETGVERKGGREIEQRNTLIFRFGSVFCFQLENLG